MSDFNIDHGRKSRLSFPEIIYGASKSTEILINILEDYGSKGENALITKLQSDKAKRLQEDYPEAFYDPYSGIFILRPLSELKGASIVAILSAGSSDIHVVNEIFYTLSFLGVAAKKINDVGVAGVHRLLDRIDELKSFRILIVVAGFEGALPSVVGGLLPQPIIAVPSDVGYGVADGGKVALHAMLSSCANGITVMNINNEFLVINIFCAIIICLSVSKIKGYTLMNVLMFNVHPG